METRPPKMMTIREIAATGLLPEHALRLMLKAGQLPVIFIGVKAMVNYDRLCEQLAALGDQGMHERRCGDEAKQ